jgi:hypothetical protein
MPNLFGEPDPARQMEIGELLPQPAAPPIVWTDPKPMPVVIRKYAAPAVDWRKCEREASQPRDWKRYVCPKCGQDYTLSGEPGTCSVSRCGAQLEPAPAMVARSVPASSAPQAGKDAPGRVFYVRDGGGIVTRPLASIDVTGAGDACTARLFMEITKHCREYSFTGTRANVIAQAIAQGRNVCKSITCDLKSDRAHVHAAAKVLRMLDRFAKDDPGRDSGEQLAPVIRRAWPPPWHAETPADRRIAKLYRQGIDATGGFF